MSLQALFNPISGPRPKTEHEKMNSIAIWKDEFSLTTFLLLGAGIQTIIFILPIASLYKIAPLLILIAFQTLDVMLPTLGITKNRLTKDIVTKKVSGQIPDRATGQLGDKPAQEGMLVLLLSAQFNHPLGAFGPGVKDLGDHFIAMNKDLHGNMPDNGLLGHSTWKGTTQAKQNALMNIYYFRDLESLNKFAHSKVHRQGWDWFNRVAREAGYTHIGLNHETFVVPKSGYESIYVNNVPTGMGAIFGRVPDEDGGDKWQSGLVDASKGAIRNQLGRMARSDKDVAVNAMEV